MHKYILPGIHPTINYRVVHAVGHRQPINAQKNFLDIRFICNLWQIGRHYEVHMKRKPAYREYHYYDYHHFYDLEYKKNFLSVEQLLKRHYSRLILYEGLSNFVMKTST